MKICALCASLVPTLIDEDNITFSLLLSQSIFLWYLQHTTFFLVRGVNSSKNGAIVYPIMIFAH